MFYRRRSVFCRLWLNSDTITHPAFLTHANHANHVTRPNFDPRSHAKILWTHSTHTKISTYATHANNLRTHGTHATHSPKLPKHPRHPRDFNMVLKTTKQCSDSTAWKLPHSGLVWLVFHHIRSEYGDLFCKPLYSVQMRQTVRTQKKLRTRTFFTQS